MTPNRKFRFLLVVFLACANGKRDSGEQCDDNNLDKADGCNDECEVEVGWSCSGGTSSAPDTCSEICGDGILYSTDPLK